MQNFPTSPYPSTMQSLHESAAFPSPLSASRSRRSRIPRACMACRRRKIKCNGDLNGCAHCEQREQQCRYEPVSDDDKFRARSYKRKLIQRRQQTRVYYNTRTYLEPAFLADPYGMAPGTAGCHTPPSAVDISRAPMQQSSLILHTATPHSMYRDSYAFLTTSSESPTQLQPINSNASFPYTTPAWYPLESLSSPSLSPSSSESSIMTPVGVSDHMHVHDFADGLQVSIAPYIDTISCTNDIAGRSDCFVEPTPSASSPEHSTLSSSDLFLHALMAEFPIAASHYKPTFDADTSTLSGAFT